uniref:NADH-ubiquinone oxidoreductase chain 1 n=1 Tax=Changeondelphax velitchkovskyi TaxID=1291384 RepID=A0A343UJA9_9HEMI|nr:NADH dehydrogenase subunit 1 [Changeondelphax velitchkovskyi]AVC55487.1 NADH dehydrogenase subunit 1 [Changeondelphax velitchkovskyi]
MFFLNFLVLLGLILISVAFYVLLERKVLGYMQMRKGPYKVGLVGLLQPFSDAIKLFSKESYFLYFGNLIIYYLMPLIGLLTSMNLWCLYPSVFNLISFPLGLLFFIVCSSFMVYSILLSSWSSNSCYSLIGCIRSVAQSISYEVCMFLVMFNLIFFLDSFNLIKFFHAQHWNWFLLMGYPLFLILYSCILAETNRSPFDFSEGESELVSGFNTEYSSFNFSFIFLAEYMNMIFMSLILSLMFLGGNFFSFIFFLKMMALNFSFIWIRGSFPRLRYDKLMMICWKIYLPISLHYFFVFMNILVFIY